MNFNVSGMKDFKGHLVHSSKYQRSLDITNKRVGIVGTGASGIQILPAIADDVKDVYVFQRTAAWAVPRHNLDYSTLMRVIEKEQTEGLSKTCKL